MIIDRFMKEGLLEEHLEKSIKENRKRRDVMLEELDAAGLEGTAWNKPEGGLYLWCRLPDWMQPSALLSRSVSNGVSFVPGSVFYPGNAPANHIRLNFTYPTPPEIREESKGWRQLTEAKKEETSVGDQWIGGYRNINTVAPDIVKAA